MTAATLSKLISELHLPHCPVCFEPMEWGVSGTIASCGHLHCIHCVRKLLHPTRSVPPAAPELRGNWRVITQVEHALPDIQPLPHHQRLEAAASALAAAAATRLPSPLLRAT